jgi:DNA-binding CsgD family transcriptional regulator
VHQILVERWSESFVLNRFIERVCQGAGGLLMIEGEYGAGRTELLLELGRLARARQLVTCTARCSTPEADLPYGVMQQLLEPHLSTVAAGTTAAAATATGLLRMMEASPPPPGTTDGQVLSSMLWAIRNLAEHGPVILAVDDVNFSDAQSLRALAYVARRLKGTPVVLAVTRRLGEPETSPSMLAALRDAGEWTVLRPAPLSAAGTRELVDGFLGPMPTSSVEEMHELTAGNPLLLTTVLTACPASRPDFAWAGWPEGALERLIHATITTRLAHLPASLVRVAETVALLDGEATRDLVAEVAGLPEAEVLTGLNVLCGMGVLRDLSAPTHVHPLVRDALRRLPGTTDPETVHALTAEALHRRDASPAEVARHLLRSGPMKAGWVPETLRAAAAAALRRCEPAQARTLLLRALEEPLVDDVRGEVQAMVDGIELTVNPHGLLPRLRARLTTSSPPADQVGTVLTYAKALLRTNQVGEATEAVEECTAALAALPQSAERDLLLCRLNGAQAVNALFGSSAATQLAGLLAELDDRADGDRSHGSSLQALQAAVEVRSPAGTAVCALRRNIEAHTRLVQDPAVLPYPLFVLLWADELELVDRWCDALLAGEQKAESLLNTVFVLAVRACSRLEAGRLAQAERDARHALELLGEQEVTDPVQALALAPLLNVLVELDRADEAVALLEARGCARALPDSWPHTLVLAARGRVRGARGDFAGALADLMESGRRMAVWGTDNPAISRWRSEAAFMRGQLGDTAGAVQLVDEELCVARRWGTPRAIGMALRAKGLLLRGEAGLASLAEAVAVLRPAAARLETAYALASLGIVQRCGNHKGEARETLRQALALAQQLGAVRLAARAHTELLAAGALPRHSEHFGTKALTACERRVARLAAVGRTNGAIARELFVTRRTVETHLTRVYRKLGIRGRSELVRALQV